MASLNGRPYAPLIASGPYTQTYTTADKTQDDPTADDLTDETGMTPDTTISLVPDVTESVLTAADLDDTNASILVINQNLSNLAAQHDALLVDMLNVKQVTNALIDDLQSLGLVT